MATKQKEIFEEIRFLVKKMDDDMILSYEILPNSRLVGDLGFESIDIVVLCTTIENHFQQQFPFSIFLAEVGQREDRDIRVEELVDLVFRYSKDNGQSHQAERNFQSPAFPGMNYPEATQPVGRDPWVSSDK